MTIRKKSKTLKLKSPPSSYLDKLEEPSKNNLKNLFNSKKTRKPTKKHFNFVSKLKTTIFNAIPILSWIQTYNIKKMLLGDFFGGLAVAFVAIPQTMAYASLAGLPPLYGLYSAILPPSIYCIFGGSKTLSVGLVAVNSLIMYSSISTLATPFSERYIQIALAASLISGIISIILGLIKFGSMITFISPGVLMGFVTASEAVITISQLEGLFGVTAEKSNISIIQCINTFKAFGALKWVALVNGIIVLAFLITLKYKKSKIPGPLVVAVVTTLASYFLQKTSYASLLPTVGFVPSGPPNFSVPQVSLADIPNLLTPALILCIIGFVQSYAIAQKYADIGDYEIDANQEFFALGVTKVCGSFFQAVDTPGSFARSNVNAEAGAKSQISSIIATLLILLAVMFLTPTLQYIPKSTLSGIVIIAVSGIFDITKYKKIYQVSVKDFTVSMLTAVVTFCTSMQIGIVMGIIFSIINILYNLARPHWAILGEINYAQKYTSNDSIGTTEASSSKNVTSNEVPDMIQTDSRSGGSVYKDLNRYKDALEINNVLIFRFDANIYFLNVSYWRSIIINLINDRIELSDDELGIKFDGMESNTKFFQKKKNSSCENVVTSGENILNEDAFNMERITIEDSEKKKLKFLILDFSPVDDLDYAGALGIVNTVRHVEEKYHTKILFASVKGALRDTFWKTVPGGIRSPRNSYYDLSESSISNSNVDNIDAVIADSNSKVENIKKPELINKNRFFLNVGYAVDYVRSLE
ncbi:hypothetical protein HK099_001912 [Clydaea vesicula]|uniref:STAS domain-containing protein n=1 Tax=Clydaea vesicula TaxID=447962 RepID=A0AAD5Y1M8_9FUNG|nr:hypothetical protein HK099_001912 [Clydaea vesicula]KAJ3395563.1 hypothetical protein HDU92_005539 [Lobulomyces angularis]